LELEESLKRRAMRMRTFPGELEGLRVVEEFDEEAPTVPLRHVEPPATTDPDCGCA
jgi:hypothetical protein